MEDMFFSERIQLTISLLVLAWGYFHVYGQMRQDRFREDIFTMRDDLFDYMWKNGLSYDLSAYRIMRDLLNGVIRFGPWLNVPHLAVLKRFARARSMTGGRVELEEAIKSLESDELRTHLKEVLKNLRTRIDRFVYRESLTGLVLMPLLALVSRFSSSRRTTSRGSAAQGARPRFTMTEIDPELEEGFVMVGKPDSNIAHLLWRRAQWIGPQTA